MGANLLAIVAALAMAACGGGGGGGSSAGGTPGNPAGGTAAGPSGTAIAIGKQMGGARQVGTLAVAAASANVGTIAGKRLWTDGVGTAAAFQGPYSIASDGTNLYVADTFNYVIRKIDMATGMVSTLAGTGGQFGYVDGAGPAAEFNRPYGIASDGTYLYVADAGNNRIRRVDIATGAVTTLAGGGAGRMIDDIGTAASFASPQGITCDGANLYVADTNNHAIRKIVLATAAVTTLAGGTVGNADGTGSAARFNWPTGVATSAGKLYVADYFNHSIRQLDIASGAVVTLAGSTTSQSGSADGNGTAASFRYPQGVVTDGTSLYVMDAGNAMVRKITLATGAVTTWAGSTTSGHADGSGTAASFASPTGGVILGANLYLTDYGNYTIRRVAIASRSVTTFAGSWEGTNGTGTAASFTSPGYMTSDGTNLYVTDEYNNNIRKIVIATGEVSTFAGSAVGDSGYADGVGTTALFYQPTGITTDGVYLYVCDSYNHNIRRVDIGNGLVTTLAGSQTGVSGSTDGGAATATFKYPAGITTDGNNLYVSNGTSNIRKVVIATGETSTFAGSTTGVRGGIDDIGTKATFTAPRGITTDGVNLYVVDETMGSIRQISLATQAVTTLAGSKTGATGSANGFGTAASFTYPFDVTTDGSKLYVTDSVNNTLRQIVIATGEVTTLAGTSALGDADGPAATATFYRPAGITSDGNSLFVADSYNKIIRRIR